MKKLISLTLFFCIFTLGIGAIVAQGPVMCPTRPVTDNSNACASTAFVVNYTNSSGNIVNTITSTDGSLTVSSPSGAVTIIINAAHTNNWTTPQGFSTIYLNGSTSGFTTLVASPVASGVWTFPNATDVIVGKATTDTFTNKTFDTAGTGNSFSINGLAATANTGTGAVVRATSPTLTTPILGAATITTVNGLTPVGQIASGSKALTTDAISSATCSSAQSSSAVGTLTTDAIVVAFSGDPTATTGYIPSTSGMLTVVYYPTADNVNFKVCNNTISTITPGGVTINWRVVR